MTWTYVQNTPGTPNTNFGTTTWEMLLDNNILQSQKKTFRKYFHINTHSLNWRNCWIVAICRMHKNRQKSPKTSQIIFFLKKWRKREVNLAKVNSFEAIQCDPSIFEKVFIWFLGQPVVCAQFICSNSNVYLYIAMSI
jgi:hypothetical protein